MRAWLAQTGTISGPPDSAYKGGPSRERSSRPLFCPSRVDISFHTGLLQAASSTSTSLSRPSTLSSAYSLFETELGRHSKLTADRPPMQVSQCMRNFWRCPSTASRRVLTCCSPGMKRTTAGQVCESLPLPRSPVLTASRLTDYRPRHRLPVSTTRT
jgi:hypothetical protein